MVVTKSTECELLNSRNDTTLDGILVASASSAGTPSPLSSHTYTSFVNKIGPTTGTTPQEYLIKRYIAKSDLISNHYRESIMNFIKTVDNKDN
jgi:hypothetical protein